MNTNECMNCGTMFESDGIQNICHFCQAEDDGPSFDQVQIDLMERIDHWNMYRNAYKTACHLHGNNSEEAREYARKASAAKVAMERFAARHEITL